MRERVRAPKRHSGQGGLLDQLVEDRLFETFEKAVVFAAAIGFRLNREAEVQPPEPGGREIPLGVFRNADDESFINALAVTCRDNLDVLMSKRSEERLEILEFFAGLGLDHIKETCYQPGRDPLDGMLDLIDRYASEDAAVGQLPGLQEKARLLGDLL